MKSKTCFYVAQRSEKVLSLTLTVKTFLKDWKISFFTWIKLGLYVSILKDINNLILINNPSWKLCLHVSTLILSSCCTYKLKQYFIIEGIPYNQYQSTYPYYSFITNTITLVQYHQAKFRLSFRNSDSGVSY